MKIKIWQAFASNNSGSYTIIGAFGSPEIAREVAAALRAVSAAQTAWLEGGGDEPIDADKSPLAAFARAEGLSWEQGRGTHDEWPEHGEKTVPDVVAAGHQVLIHVDYTVSMPSTLGEYFYKRGGRVSTELDHAHEPIIARFAAWWRNDSSEAAIAAVIAELTAHEGPLVTHCAAFHPPAWRAGAKHGMGSLELVCVFDDLCAGVAGVSDAIARSGGSSRLEIAELDARINPMASLRPCQPASVTRQWDVFVGQVRKGPQLRQQLAYVLRVDHFKVDKCLDRAPGVILRGLFEPTAKQVRDVLLSHGIEHELR